MPGRITRLPGGVALNIAMALSRFGLRPALLSSVGQDAEGHDLIAACTERGIETSFIHRSNDLPTDQYMAIEGANGLIAAIAHAHALERAGEKILEPLRNGALQTPFAGPVALDGNLTPELLEVLALSPDFDQADLRVAPASPGKALRLAPFVAAGRGTLYVNLEEAGLLCKTDFRHAQDAALTLVKIGAARAVVTNGGSAACVADANGTVNQDPPAVEVARVTGAGDTFMAAHIAAELRGGEGLPALEIALDAAAQYVSGKTTI